LEPVAGDRFQPARNACSCPVAFDCKHVAAALLKSNAAHVESHEDSEAGARSTVAALAPASALLRTTPATMPESDWRRALRGGAASTRSSTALTPLALQFEAREETRPARGRWQRTTKTTVPATAYSHGTPRIGMRPVMRGKSGRWVAGDLSWASMQYHLNRLDLDERQVRWFRHVLALSRTQSGPAFSHDPDRIYLDDFASPLLWRLLADAAGLGIELVSSGKGGSVELEADAQVTLDATRTDTGGIRLTPTVRLGERQVDARTVHAIGDHGLYSLDWAPEPRLLLAPVDGALTEDERRLLGAGTVEIPADDVGEFFDAFYPAMRTSVRIESADATVQFPEIVPPTLVLTATFRPEHVLELAWSWEGPRDPDAEAAIVADIEYRLGEQLVGTVPTTLRGIATAEFVEHVLPRIEALEEVRVDIVGERGDYRELHATPTLTVSTVETDQRDWFDLGVLVHVEGRRVPFEPLFRALSKGESKLLLVDKTYLSLKQPLFDPLRELIAEAQELNEWEVEGLRISRYQAGLWAEFEDLADESEQAVAWRDTVGGLLELTDEKPPGAAATPLPDGLNATLRPYQRDGFEWLTFLWRNGLGGVLADDMGLGKTLQTLALIAQSRQRGGAAGRANAPFLVVAPTSVVSNWASEAAKFTPDLTVAAITKTRKKAKVPIAEQAAGADIVITSYTLFRLDFEEYRTHEWGGLILDEAQFVKNHTSRAHRCARDLHAPFKLAITGTPMENNLMELWSMFDIVAPGLFPSSRKFQEQYVRPIAAAGSAAQATPAEHGAELIARLRRRIRPLMLRRTKELVAPELPPKQEQVLRLDLAPAHRRLYDMFLQRERQKLLGLIDDLDRNRFIVFRSLTLLRMLSLDASLVDPEYADVPSSKLDVLFEQLDDVLAEGHRTLIFSQFTSFLRKAADRLDEQGIEYAYLDGSTTGRAKVIERFKSGAAPVFLVSLKAGGFGLNLTEADYVFMLDPWWNPASEAQAIDRTHRIGQTKNVMVYRLVANGTIEEKVMALKEQKARLFDAVLDDDGVFSSALTADDIRGLLE
jgi:superfamily II DNA or RNA helicase